MAGLVPAIHVFLVADIAVSVPSSFRGDAKHRTMVRNCAPENLEIPRCAIAHLRSGPSDHPGMTVRETWMPGTRPGMTNVERVEPDCSRVLDVLLETGIDQFTLHEGERRLVVEL